MTSFSSSAAPTKPELPLIHDGLREPSACQSPKDDSSRTGLTDQERESHIRACASLMQIAMDRWYETGDFGYRGEASRWKVLMEEAIRGRSPAYVAQLERERGLSGR